MYTAEKRCEPRLPVACFPRKGERGRRRTRCLSPAVLVMLLLGLLGADAFAVDGTEPITTVAGNGTAGFSGDGGPATAASLRSPEAVAIHGTSLYISDTLNHRIRRVDLDTGLITTIAGTGLGLPPVPSDLQIGEGGLATAASLQRPQGLNFDIAGHLFVADGLTRRVRRIDAVTGIITTVAGSAGAACSGTAVPATSAFFQTPTDVTFGPNGDLYLGGNCQCIRSVDSVSGIVTTVAGTLGFVGGFSGDGGPAGMAQLSSPLSLAFDGANNYYIAELHNHRVRRVDAANGIITTVAGTGLTPFNGDNILATMANLDRPTDVAVDDSGHLYISVSGHNRVRKVDAVTGLITTVVGTGTGGFSGDGGPANLAQLTSPSKLAFDSGFLYISDRFNHRIRRVGGGTSCDDFVRGDANSDGLFDISDAIKILDVLFLAGLATCEAALDGNDDNLVDISDAIFELNALFGLGPLPPSPFPMCGDDPNCGLLSCDSVSACP